MTALHDIQLSATEGNWRLFMVRKADNAFLAFQDKVHARDQWTCQYCGFSATQFLEVVNLDGNYRNNAQSNLVTACRFCAQCFFLESIGKGDFGGGTLVYLPEMTQGQLNALCHVLFMTMATGSSAAIQARNVYRSFKLRAQLIEKQLGEGLSHPALLGRLCVDGLSSAALTQQPAFMSHVRLLPEMSRFAEQIEELASTALRELTFDQVDA